ncbi:MAG: pyrroline-5-carboxylate reductase [Simkania sp.]|nr:pyrroline-5-carboxylate reductase [Simkania sp.]
MRITTIGCGTMGGALSRRLSSKNLLTLFDRDPLKASSLATEIGAGAAPSLTKAIEGAEIVLLAIKPKDLEALAKEMLPHLAKETLVISILAGISVNTLERFFPKQPVLRIMPNLAVTCEKGIIGVVEPSDMSERFHEKIKELFGCMGLLIFLPENKIDALTAIAASAPAFVFHCVEAMTEGGIFLGFPAELSLEIILQVFEGAIALLRETKEHPAALKWKVASPGGTTIEGLKVLEEQKVHYALIQALQATYLKATSIL